ncbi:MAG: 2-amino-4-hydroxy-6-hydroxymethyldihydropteridine diphosphokinase [Gemmatimonadota bacterium]
MSPPRTVVLLLGSNIDPERNLPLAVDRLRAETRVDALSRVYETDPIGAPGTPRFLNAAVRISTDLTLHRLRADVLRPIENGLGRVRLPDPNAPRTIDIDIVFVPGLVLEDAEAGLWIPEPELAVRPHIAVPVADVAGDDSHPITGDRLGALAARLARESSIVRRADVVLTQGGRGDA